MTTGAQVWRWDDVPLEVNDHGGSKRWVTGEHLMVAEISSVAGTLAAAHAHDSEQMTWVLAGRLRCTLGEAGADEVVEVGPGEILLVPPHVPHATETLEDTRQIDLWSPPRRAWADLRAAALGDPSS